MSFLAKNALKKIGFLSYGEDVLISDKASIYNPQKIKIGSHVRIDDFCILSAGEGGIILGDYIHIACYVSLIGKETIQIDDFVGLSSKSAIYSSNDDYSGHYLTGPTVPEKFRNVTHGKVHLKKHVIIGSGTIILPNVTIGEGTAVGALSLVSKNVEEFKIVVGNPFHILRERNRNLKDLESQLMKEPYV